MLETPTPKSLISIEKSVNYIKLTPDQRKRLIALLTKSNNLDIKERSSKCEYTERSMVFRPNQEPIRRSVYCAAVAAPDKNILLTKIGSSDEGAFNSGNISLSMS